MNRIVLQIVCYFAVLASVAFRTECVCSTKCPTVYAPVCGSDGKTYSNKCVLEVAACQTGKTIKVAHDGVCDPACKKVTCPPGKVCVLNSKNRPECVCNKICTDIYLPVCGSDGKTYGNKCELDVAACENYKITMAHNGECNKRGR